MGPIQGNRWGATTRSWIKQKLRGRSKTKSKQKKEQESNGFKFALVQDFDGGDQKFDDGIYDCFSDCGSCMYGYFCGMCAFAKQMVAADIHDGCCSTCCN